MPSENNKRIAKNTLLLYFRMLLNMGVSLYTVRVVLETLGVVDYGLYNVVGGVVTMFSFLSNTMASASQRFYAFELGRGDMLQLKRTFSMTLQIYFLLAIIILLFAETIGLWFLNTQMTIPIARMDAARWVYQFSILSFMMTMFTTPYNALIIAHERMTVYAWVSILEVVLKLLIVYVLVLFDYDKLKLYAVLMFLVTTFITFVYRTYSKRKFKECGYSYYWDSILFKEIASYSGWNLFGAVAGIFQGQGINLILNMSFGPIVNAARGIAYQVNSAVNQFVLNFVIATRPQITKYYAIGDKDKMLTLVFRSSKFSFLLLFILSIPFLLETNFIFKIWLKEIPDYVVLFTRLVLVSTLIDSLSYPLMAAAQATGKIKTYQAVVGSIMLLNLPLSFLFLKIGYSAPVVFYISIFNSIICLFFRLLMLNRMINLSVIGYLSKVILPLICVTIVSYIFPLLLSNQMEFGFVRFLTVSTIALFCTLISIFFLGLSYMERIYSIQILKKIKGKR